jgi:hypothetical protein
MIECAVDVAAERGVLGPSAEHLLLALAFNDNRRGSAILRELGIDDVVVLTRNRCICCSGACTCPTA